MRCGASSDGHTTLQCSGYLTRPPRRTTTNPAASSFRVDRCRTRILAFSLSVSSAGLFLAAWMYAVASLAETWPQNTDTLSSRSWRGPFR